MKLIYRKFPKIYRVEQEEADSKAAGVDSLLDLVNRGAPFWVTEKIDGANSCVEVIKENGEFKFAFYSHRKRLDKDNTLRGFYEFANKVLVPKIKNMYRDANLLHKYLYGEWLVPHRVEYKADAYNHWYLFSIYDALTEQEEDPDVRFAMAGTYGINSVPQFITDEDKSIFEFDYIDDAVGRSCLATDPDRGEGIVIECGDVRVKIVSDKFKEVRKSKKLRPSQSASERFIDETATEARITKMIGKFKDENLFSTSIDYKHFGDLARPLTEAVWHDILDEEFKMIPYDFDGKRAWKRLNKIIPRYLRELIDKETK